MTLIAVAVILTIVIVGAVLILAPREQHKQPGETEDA